ncbi:MAG: diadenylate cyclase CdaA [Bdellovibrionales bacterium]|nr:diadenylate cyclase CdaA [Bdellovibrionales bacterium]
MDGSFFIGLWENLQLITSQLRLQDLVDLFLVWVVIYQILQLTKRSGAVQILSGLGILAVAYLVSIWLELFTFNWLLEKFFANLFLIVVILFQAEIRAALAQIGANPFLYNVSKAEETHILEEIAKGTVQLAQKGIGALIVIEREIALDYFIEVGTEIDAAVTSELITTIFNPQSPMHDGALVIRGGRAFAAGCFLPLSRNPILDKNLGTRHRAAVGLTEETDAFVLVVSEETKTVSMVQNGQLEPDADHADIRQRLYQVFDLKFRTERATV